MVYQIEVELGNQTLKAKPNEQPTIYIRSNFFTDSLSSDCNTELNPIVVIGRTGRLVVKLLSDKGYTRTVCPASRTSR